MRTKPRLRIAVLAAAMVPARLCVADNPIIQTRFTADPAPMVDRGTVYLYTSHDEDDARGFLMRDWLCYTSTDMVNWTDHGAVASLHNFRWADKAISGWGGFENGAWAPQCIARNGKYYLYCPVQGRGIGVLVADQPYGPFTDPLGKPLIGPQYDSIDPTVFIDDDGQAYLYWGNPNLWYVKLNKDMISYSGDPRKDSSFAKATGRQDPFHYQEGPWAYKRQGRYYMAYASTCCPEGIGYAMSASPTGPWSFQGYIVRPNDLSSGNHPGIIDYKGKSYVFGFNYTLNRALTSEHRERRSVCVAELTYNADGTIPELPWWRPEGVAQIGYLTPYRRAEAETICSSEGIRSLPSSQGGMSVYPTRDGAYIKVKGVNFGKGARSFQASVASEGAGGTIELHQDSLTGPLLGTCAVTNTGSAQKWETVSCGIKDASGVHDLYLVFTSTETSRFHVDWWIFHR